MEISPPETFVTFLQTILEAETEADLWKSKLFYFPPEQVAGMFGTDKLIPPKNGQPLEEIKPTVCIEKVMKFLNGTLNLIMDCSSQESQKVICKYFSFNKGINCPQETFLKRLKPTNNKLILKIQKQNLKLEQSLFGLFTCILQGYVNIKRKRQECAKNINQILSYFQNKMGFYKGLSIEMLKEIAFEANLYGRINFSYLKDYVFGEDQSVIGWETLFGIKVQEGIEKIQELSEQNIVSERFIRQSRSRLCESVKEETEQCNFELTPKKKSQIYLESVSDTKTFSEPVSIYKIHPINEDYSNVLSQINQIETLLNKTKERYQKNRQNLEKQTDLIKNQHLKRSQNLGKLCSSSQKNSSKYENLKIHEMRERITLNVEKKQVLAKIEVPSIGDWQNESSVKKIERIDESPFKVLNLTRVTEESRVQTPKTPLAMKNEVIKSIRQSNSSQTSLQITDKREAGKIKRRSISKDVGNLDSTNAHKTQLTSNYGEYEAVLQEIKREENMYKKMVEDREKILNGRKIQRRLDLGLSSSLHRKTSSFTSTNSETSVTPSSTSRELKLNTLQKQSSQTRYQSIIKEIETNTLSRSRVSSKKREEIVQKATSQARLRIQEIENRALKRLAKLDTDISVKNHTNQSSYLKLQTTETGKRDTPKYRPPMKENTTGIRSQKSPQSVNLFMNDLFNERPSLRLSVTTSICKAKY